MFAHLPDEDAVHILFQLYTSPSVFKDLTAISLTCRNGYELMQDSVLIKSFAKAWFSHLPQEYLSLLMQDKKEEGPALLHSLLQQLLAYQTAEIKQLKEVLSPWRFPLEEQERASPLNKVHSNTLQSLLACITTVESSNNKKKFFELYYAREQMLDGINTAIIKICLVPLQCKKRKETIDGTETEVTTVDINLIYALSRLPTSGVKTIKEILSLGHIDEVKIFLSFNNLRWLPDNLFSIKNLNFLHIENNLLSYIPQSIVRAKDYLKFLITGNLEYFEGLVAFFNDEINCRTSGNTFKIFPSAILELSQLQTLNIRSVELEEVPGKIYEFLPKLRFLNVSHNNLNILPQSNVEDRKINVMSFGNPASVKRSFLLEYPDQVTDTLYKSALTPMKFIARNPNRNLPILIIASGPLIVSGCLCFVHGPGFVWWLGKRIVVSTLSQVSQYFW